MKTFFKIQKVRDPEWRRYIPENMHCMFTGAPMPNSAHISSYSAIPSMSDKEEDDKILPICQTIHMEQMHRIGECPTLRMYWPKLRDEDFMFFVRAGAEKLYRLWKAGELADNFFMR